MPKYSPEMIRTVAETLSTNDDVAAMARDGAPEGTWLRAERQTGGKGRQGRRWESPPGNLHASTLVRLRADDRDLRRRSARSFPTSRRHRCGECVPCRRTTNGRSLRGTSSTNGSSTE